MKKEIIAALELVFLASGLVHGGQMNTGMDRVNYGRPFEPPTRPAFIPLPPGAVEPAGWLHDWCLAMRDGYTGHMDDFDVAFKQAWAANHKMTGDHLNWHGGGWPYEGGGYWFDGLVRLGYALHDEALINQARSRFDAVITNMNEKGISFLWWLDRNSSNDLKYAEGRHYPETEWPFWANGLFGRSLAAYCAASRDPRAIGALEAGYTGSKDWVRLGWGLSNPWPAYEAYTWTGNLRIKDAVTEFFTRPGDDKRPWPFNRYRQKPTGNPGNDHVVHFLESTAPWALGYLWTGNREFLDAPVAWHEFVERDSMQPFGVIVADEHYGPTGAFRSTETCDVAAHIWSKLLLLAIGGDGVMADRIERALFNAAPAMVSRDGRNHVYLQSPNRMENRSLPPAAQCTYAPVHGPLCCTASLTRPLPYYVTHMWMATYDNGLAATLYGPCKVSALVADAVPVELLCRTDYPFNESIEVVVKPAREAKFPLSFRIPNWCKQAALAINGAPTAATPDAKGFVRIERTWKTGDTVRLQFPMSVEVNTGRDRNVTPPAPYATVSYGPLLFALPIADTKDANTPDPAAKWNYALDAVGKKPGTDITVERDPMPDRWNWPLASPLKLHANAVSFEWTPNPKTPLPSGPVDSNNPQEMVTLIPYGCTKFRISMMPVTKRTLELAEKERMDRPANNDPK